MHKNFPFFTTAGGTENSRGGYVQEKVMRMLRSRAPLALVGLLSLISIPAASALQYTVAWDINSTGQLGFDVERSTDGTNFVQIATVAATVNSYVDQNVTSGSYWYRVRAFDSASYSGYSNVAATTSTVIAPSFTTQPSSQSVNSGSNVTFSAVAGGSPSPTYQWFKNGTAISGATGSSLTLSNVSSVDAATYTVQAANSGGSVTSIGAVLTILVTTPLQVAPSSWIASVSARAIPGQQGSQSLNMDFTVKGATKSVLVRAIGPALSSFTTAATFVDPKIALSSGGVTVGTNDNWDGSAATALLFTKVGAFPLRVGSKDAALVASLAPKSYSAVLSGKAGGIAMIEAYDADASGGHLSQLDVRAPVGTGDGRLITGFTIGGSTSLHVLIRAVGPSIGGKGTLADPVLEIYSGSTLVQRNDNWGGTSALTTAFTQAGATSLNAQSKDSAIELTLAPGTYTATVYGNNNGTGVAQFEIYELP